jgi:hypothetical protein
VSRGERSVPATPPTGTDPGLVHNLIDRLAIHFSQGVYVDEAAEARADFFAQSGELHEEDAELFEPRMAACLEWYVIERPLRDSGVSAARQYLDEESDRLAPNERDALIRLASSRRSLFSIKSVKAGQVTLVDLLGGSDVVALERRGTVGFTVDDICEARVCESEGAFIFTKTLLFHPRDAVKQIKTFIKAGRKAGEDLGALPFRLARLYLRWHRQGHVSADRIYREGLARSG